jgi:hypothetical protein
MSTVHAAFAGLKPKALVSNQLSDWNLGVQQCKQQVLLSYRAPRTRGAHTESESLRMG